MEKADASLYARGYTQIKHHIDMKNKNNSRIIVTGALFVIGDGIRNVVCCSVSITAAPDYAALKIKQASGDYLMWAPAAGTFFRSIERNG